jgi:penicillin-binding protein 1B
MELGLDAVIDMLNNLGLEEDIDSYPSLLLGAVELPPIEVLQMYQTIAAGGYKTPLRAILAVTDLQNNTLQRYPLIVEQTVDPSAVFCLSNALQAVTTRGTASSLQQLMPEGLTVAGKTGTTDKLRDSWFAGYSGMHVAVAWVGRDDNKPTGLTGATGALGVWATAMAGINTSSLQLQPPNNINWYYSDTSTGQIFNQKCNTDLETLLPFINNGVLPEVINCGRQGNNLERTLQKGLESILDFLE